MANDVFVRAIQRIGTATGGGAPTLAPPEGALILDAATFAITDDPTAIATGPRGESITGVSRITATGAASLPGQTLPWLWTTATAASVDATTHTLFTIPVGAASWVRFWCRVMANLGDGPNANAWPSLVEVELSVTRTGSGAPQAADGDTSVIHKPFIENQATPTAGGTNTTVSGNSLLIQATGFAPPSAWASGHAYVIGDGISTPGDFVTANGNVYVCSTAGTSSGSAPTGTGTGLGTGAKFDCVAVGKSYVPIKWTGFIWAFTQG